MLLPDIWRLLFQLVVQPGCGAIVEVGVRCVLSGNAPFELRGELIRKPAIAHIDLRGRGVADRAVREIDAQRIRLVDEAGLQNIRRIGRIVRRVLKRLIAPAARKKTK